VHQALQVYEKMLNSDTVNNMQILNDVGICLYRQKKYGAAEQRFLECLKYCFGAESDTQEYEFDDNGMAYVL